MIWRKTEACGQSEPSVAARCYSSVLHEPFALLPFLPLYVALPESQPGRHSKNRCSNALYDRLEEWLPTMCGRFFRFDTPDSHMPPLVSSFDTTRSRSTLASSSSAQMTTAHPIPVSSHLHHSHPALPAFRSRLAAFLLFFIHEITEARDTPNVRSIPRKLLRSS